MSLHHIASSNRVTATSHDLHLDTDVLVIGGSIAGCIAALSARAAGARVVVAEKGYVGTSGVVAAATCGGYHVVPESPETTEKAVHFHHGQAEGFDDLDFIRAVLEECYRVGTDLAELGFVSGARAPVPGVDTNNFRRLTSFKGPYSLHFLRTQLQKAGVKILDHSPALELLRHEGVVSGAAGVNRQTDASWAVRARAVILATGGNAFHSGVMGTHGTTGDGHLLAAEVGAGFTSMEFSGHYGMAPGGSSITKGFWYSSGTFFDGNGRELDVRGWGAVPHVAKAQMETGSVSAIIKGDADYAQSARRASPNIFQYFDRVGIDPFRERFPVTLLYEGLVRSIGGLVVDRDAATGVPGLYAAGDVAERRRMTGVAMSGAGPAISWCLASGRWSGRAAAAYALQREALPADVTLEGAGLVGLRPKKNVEAEDGAAAGLKARVQAEVLPIEKNVYRSISGIDASLKQLDAAWQEAGETLRGSDARAMLRAREAAAAIAGARWIYRSARERKESRGLHRLVEHPNSDARELSQILASGLDDICISRSALRLEAGEGDMRTGLAA